MRVLKTAAVLLGVALVAIPAGAAIKAMTLKETMEIHTDVLQARITGKTTVKTDRPLEGMVYTHMTVEGESLITGEKVTRELVFLGSHDPADGYGTSEMPTLQDTRPGNEVVVFYTRDEQFPGGANVVDNLASVFRVEQAFGTPVLMGKGEGTAFAENIRLADARALVKTTHESLKAAAGPQDGK